MTLIKHPIYIYGMRHKRERLITIKNGKNVDKTGIYVYYSRLSIF